MGRRRDPEWTEPKWRIKRARSARTYRACAMYRTEKNTAEKPVVMREVKMWRSRVNAIIRHVRLRFGSLGLEALLTWSANHWSVAPVTSLERIHRQIADATCGRRMACEVHKTEFVAFSLMLPCVRHY